jgi:hypothetical protein
VWTNNYRQFDHFFDFYAGKVGHVRVNFMLDGEEHDVDKLYVMNGADMCFLRKHLSYNWTKLEQGYKNYAPTALDMREGSVVFSKTKAMTDTLCDEEDEYFSNGVIDIANAVLDACKGGNPSQDVELTIHIPPSRAIFKKDGQLCEERVARDGKGGFSGTFTLFCYDFKDLPCAVDLSAVQEYLIIDYTTNLTTMETANTYFYKGKVWNEGQMRFGLNWDLTTVPGVNVLATGVEDWLEANWDPLVSGALNLLYSFPMNMLRYFIPAKQAFPQSRLDMYDVTFHYDPSAPAGKTGTVEVSTVFAGPAVYMNWEDIYTDEHPNVGNPLTDLSDGFNDYISRFSGTELKE